MSSTEAPEILTVEEAADYLKVSPSQIRVLVKSDAIPYFRIGKLIRIPKDSIAPSLLAEIQMKNF